MIYAASVSLSKEEKGVLKYTQYEGRQQMSEPLKPCPFCGTADDGTEDTPLIMGANRHQVVVECINCGGSQVRPAGNGFAEVVAAWNRRVQPESSNRKWWIVIGRLEGDDEDSLKVYSSDQVQTYEQAEKMFEQEMRETAASDLDEHAEQRDCYLNCTIECDTKPKIRYSQGIYG